MTLSVDVERAMTLTADVEKSYDFDSRCGKGYDFDNGCGKSCKLNMFPVVFLFVVSNIYFLFYSIL